MTSVDAAGLEGDADMASQVLRHGLRWALLLGSANLALHVAARRAPKGWLSRRVSGGLFNLPAHFYLVSTSGQAFIQPVLWSLAFFGRDERSAWWFGAQAQWAVGEWLAYSFGYFLQDMVTHYSENDALIVLHHVGSMFAAWLLCKASGWIGFLLTIAQAMELGSLAVELGDLRLAPRRPAAAALLLTSVAPAAATLAGALLSPPPDLASGFIVVTIPIVAFLRSQEARKLLA